jgi:hypothetical protein
MKVAFASNGPRGPSFDYFLMLAEWEHDTLPEYPASAHYETIQTACAAERCLDCSAKLGS